MEKKTIELTLEEIKFIISSLKFAKEGFELKSMKYLSDDSPQFQEWYKEHRNKIRREYDLITDKLRKVK